MLSRISDTATGAVGLANEVIFFCILMFGFVGIGTSVAVSQYIGAGLEQEASRISALAITINLVFGILVSIVLVGFGETIMRLMNLSPGQIGMASHYLKIIGGFICHQFAARGRGCAVSRFDRRAVVVGHLGAARVLFGRAFGIWTDRRMDRLRGRRMGAWRHHAASLAKPGLGKEGAREAGIRFGESRCGAGWLA